MTRRHDLHSSRDKSAPPIRLGSREAVEFMPAGSAKANGELTAAFHN